MIGKMVAEVRRKTAGVDWAAIAPRCGWRGCSRRARWQGVVRRLQGVRFEGACFCGTECFQAQLEARMETVLSLPGAPAQARHHRVPLGLLLLSRGLLNKEHLDAALQRHRETGLRLGQCLRELHAVSEDHITAAIASQWGCGVYPEGGRVESMSLVPRLLQEEYRCAPLHWVEAGRSLFIGFEHAVNYTLLLGIERMLDCHTEACIVSEKELERRLMASSAGSDHEVEFATLLNPSQMALTVAGYAQQLQVERIRFFDCRERIWFRLEHPGIPFDLFFRRAD
ncbi:MAG: hypothetical protein ACM3JB_11380 [Acidobacteriaceae bacterium]